jgi:hypothetical protein
MPTYRLSVTDPTGNTILAAVTISTYACDGRAEPCASATPPDNGGWAATWAQGGGQAGSHAPVYSSAATMSRIFATEDAAHQGARRGVYDHYQNSLQRNVRLVP